MQLILNVDAIQPPLTGIGHYALQLARGPRPAPASSNRLAGQSGAGAAREPEARLRLSPCPVSFKTLALHLYNFARSQLFRWKTRHLQDAVLHTPNYVPDAVCRGGGHHSA